MKALITTSILAIAAALAYSNRKQAVLCAGAAVLMHVRPLTLIGRAVIYARAARYQAAMCAAAAVGRLDRWQENVERAKREIS